MKSIFVLASLILFVAPCQAQQEQTSQPTSKEAEKVQEIGAEASQKLLKNLQAALMEAMQEGGAVNAITVCKDTAQILTGEISESLGEGISIKRTSVKYRNPANAPDAMEKSVLERYAIAAARGEELPPFILQKFRNDGDWVYRYCKPLKVMQLCTNCHGAESQIDPEVKTVIEAKYPQDRATGYETGDFRGVVSVTMTETFVRSTSPAE